MLIEDLRTGGRSANLAKQSKQDLSFVCASISDFDVSLNILQVSKEKKAARALDRRGNNE